MTRNKAEMAKELLALERIYQGSGKLDANRAQRWRELATQLFDRETYRRRRSFRIPMAAEATIRIGQESVKCQIRDASRLGLAVSDPALSSITHETDARLVAVRFQGKESSLDIACHIVRVEVIEGKAVVGLELTHNNSSAATKAFFECAYYPLYISYLEHLATAG
jgi:hypothetical protein